MSKEKQLTEHESLKLITDMIQKAKASTYNEDGTSAILWGSVIAFCGICTYLQIQFNFSIGFDVWILTLIAIVPQIFISIKESKQRLVKTDAQETLNAIWQVFGISIFMLVFYVNTVSTQADALLASEGKELLIKNLATGSIKHQIPFSLSVGSLFLILYGIPTLTTGIARKFKPMIIGGILCYCMFIASCFTAQKYDFLLTGIAGIVNWLIPGIILRNRFKKGIAC